MLRRSFLFASPLTPESLQILRRKVLVRHIVATSAQSFMYVDDFIRLCTTAANESTGHGSDSMSQVEAEQFLESLHNARIVIHVPSQNIVHLNPLMTLNRIQREMRLPAINPCVAESKSLDSIHEEIEAHEKRAVPALRQTAIYRKRFWSAVALGSGLQMSAMSYLTFVAYGWDTMEPISFFLTAVTALVFYCYFIVFRREHSLAEVDSNVLPRVLDAKLQYSAVDVDKWMEAVSQAEELEKKVSFSGLPPEPAVASDE